MTIVNTLEKQKGGKDNRKSGLLQKRRFLSPATEASVLFGKYFPVLPWKVQEVFPTGP